MNTDCKRCLGRGYLSVNGDDARLCPDCKGEGVEPSPAPVTVQVGAYEAKVEYRGLFVHLSCKFFHRTEKLSNTIVEPNFALALGRALVTSCRPDTQPIESVGWDWKLNEKEDTGEVLLQGKWLPLLPDTLTHKSAYECGVALVQLGVLMKARREITTWLGNLDMRHELAV